jgi:glycosyltransferase involved in cell wall biosynthesis
MPNVSEVSFSRLNSLDVIDEQLWIYSPDFVIVLACTEFSLFLTKLRSVHKNCPVFYWLPYEGSVVPEKYGSLLRNVDPAWIVHLSNFGKDCWSSYNTSHQVIPHGVDINFWRNPRESVKELRKKWSYKLRYPIFEDSYVVLNYDRNIWHKRWDLTYDYVAKLKKVFNGKNVILLAHCKIDEPGTGTHPEGYNLELLEQVYGLENSVCYTDFDWSRGLTREDLRELIALSDIRVTTSMGEGFGIPTIEVASMGKLQIVNNQTTAPELLGPDNPMLVEPAATEHRKDSLWKIPNTTMMVQRTLQLESCQDTKRKLIDTTKEYVINNFSSESVVQRFLDLHDKWSLHSDARFKRYSLGMYNDPSEYVSLVSLLQSFGFENCIVEVGCRTCETINLARKVPLNFIATDCDLEFATFLSRESIPYVYFSSLDEPWPVGSAIVLTRALEYILKFSKLTLRNIAERISKYQWAFLDLRNEYIFGERLVPVVDFKKYLLELNFVRRADLEKEALSQDSKLKHEIWSSVSSLSAVPMGLAASKMKRS